MKKNRLVYSVLAALNCMPYTIHAENLSLDYQGNLEDEFMDYYGGEEFVSIATGSQKSVAKAPAVASVITADQITKIGATNLDEILELVPGLHVSPSTVSRLDPVYSIRSLQTGFNPQVLVLLNGTEFKNSFSGGLPFTFRLPAQNIERVEVIRGPGSALYGADAFSGVINIVTKDIPNDSLTLGARVGSFESRDFWLQFGTQWNDIEFDVSIESQNSDGDPDRIVTSDLQSTIDSIVGTNASLAPGPLQTNYDILDIHASAKWRDFKLEHWIWEQNDGGLGPGGAQVLDFTGTQNVNLYRTKLTHKTKLSNNVFLSSDVSYLSVDSVTFFTLFPENALLPIDSNGNLSFANPVNTVLFTDGYLGSPHSDHKDTRMGFSIDYDGILNHELKFGFGWFKQELDTSEFKNFGPGIMDGTETVVGPELTDISNTPYVYVPDSERTNRHLVVQDVWQISNDWEVTLGLRYDDFSDFGSTTNPRMAVVWAADHDLTVKALYGSAFRAPSFNDQFLQNNPSAVGNPNLVPEEVDTFELGFNYQINFNTKLALNFYSFEADKLITRVPTPNSSLLLTQNGSTLDGKGVELELNWSYEKFNVDFNFSHQDTKDPNSDDQIPFVATNMAYLGAFFDVSEKLSVGITSHWISGRERASDDNRDESDDYFLSNLSVNYMINNQFKAKVIVKNLLNDDIYEPSSGTIEDDFRMPTRSLWLEVESKFTF
ncbi:TonB-dependent receptor plug domain-containing protein [Alteromonas sp. a30]|uniref:TonB-dependent receptor plug domain-containing protein n=1 Tax=Alteromonas sp. a30 TaxID=2730917 RepID=UPI002280629D|nr:TonB-dependent receptor [Alteromonas sp. a30]MCY7294159.1 TonB-dependent receptor [Alteromonas sp. a30]